MPESGKISETQVQHSGTVFLGELQYRLRISFAISHSDCLLETCELKVQSSPLSGALLKAWFLKKLGWMPGTHSFPDLFFIITALPQMKALIVFMEGINAYYAGRNYLH